MKTRAKAVVTLLVIGIIAIVFISAVSSAPEIVSGDVNMDGQVDIRDVVLIKQYILGILELSEEQLSLADVSGDDVVDIQDLTRIMQHVLKIDPEERKISSLEAAIFEVSINTDTDDISFPDTVQATLDDGSVETLKVEWDDFSEPPYSKDEPGKYLFEGELVNLPHGISNSEGLKAETFIKIVVEDEPLTTDSELHSLSLLVEPAQAGQAVGSGDYEEGDNVQLSVQEVDPAYQFVNWTLGNNVVSSDLNFDYEMPAEDIMIVANFILSDGETFSELGGEIAQVVVGVFNISLPYNVVDSYFSNITRSSRVVLHVADKASLVLEYNEVQDAFFKPAVQGYFENEIENAQVSIK